MLRKRVLDRDELRLRWRWRGEGGRLRVRVVAFSFLSELAEMNVNVNGNKSKREQGEVNSSSLTPITFNLARELYLPLYQLYYSSQHPTSNSQLFSSNRRQSPISTLSFILPLPPSPLTHPLN